MNIAITVPIYHSNEIHAEFTQKVLESVVSKHDIRVYLVVNHSTPELYPKKENYRFNACVKGFSVFGNDQNNVSKAWNTGIKRALKDGNDYVIIANNDIIFHPKAIDNLVDFAEKHKEFILWTASEWGNMRTIISASDEDIGDSFDEHPHFSCFMVNQNTVVSLQKKERGTKEPFPGYFDENYIPGYMEDQDFAHRIYRSLNKSAKTASARFYHFGSRTIKVDEDLFDKNRLTYEKCRAYFKKKWDYDPHEFCPESEEDRLDVSFEDPFNNQ